MSETKRVIFREVALQHYKQSRSRDVLPRYISPPVFLLMWIFCGLCACAIVLAGNTHVPVYSIEPGIILPILQAQDRKTDLEVIIFLSPDQLARVHTGEPVQLQATSGIQWNQRITHVESTLLSPMTIRQRYHLDAQMSLLITQPSGVAVVALRAASIPTMYEGSLVRAQIQTATQSLLSMLPVVNTLMGA